MPKEILIYGAIHSLSVSDAMNAMAEVDPDDGMFLRINTDGGQPQDGFGIMAKFGEYTGEKTVQVDGRAYSTGLFLLCYAEKVNALDVSKFMVHRAGYSRWFEESEYFTPELKSHLIDVNKDLERAFRAKIDVKKFEELKGVKIKEIFNIDKPRTDVFFDAKEAKQIGLVDKVIKLTPKMAASINSNMVELAAKYPGGNMYDQNEIVETPSADSNNDEQINSQIKNDNMNKKELLAAHPEVCSEIKADGVAEEKARVEAWMANLHIDADAVKAGIESGKGISQKDIVEFGHKLQAKIVADATKDDADKNATLDLDANNASEKGGADNDQKSDLEKIEARIDAHLNINH